MTTTGHGEEVSTERSTIDNVNISVLIPCYNEASTIQKIVIDFRAALPAARIFVYDNNSTDDSAKLAQAVGAIVVNEPIQGKGNVVRRMFADIESDVYLLVDGDDTYDASSAPAMIRRLLSEQLDMVNGARVSTARLAYRHGHRFGNVMLTSIVRGVFGKGIVDMLSGYRIFSRRFVKSFPALSRGFEIETELTVHALELRMPIAEIQTFYKERPDGSFSKLRTYRDGIRILSTIAVLVKEERPLLFFSWTSLVLAILSLFLAWPLLETFLREGIVPRLPTAVLSTGIMLLACLSLVCGLVLDTVTRGRAEMKRMFYLQLPAPGYPRF